MESSDFAPINRTPRGPRLIQQYVLQLWKGRLSSACIHFCYSYECCIYSLGLRRWLSKRSATSFFFCFLIKLMVMEDKGNAIFFLFVTLSLSGLGRFNVSFLKWWCYHMCRWGSGLLRLCLYPCPVVLDMHMWVWWQTHELMISICLGPAGRIVARLYTGHFFFFWVLFGTSWMQTSSLQPTTLINLLRLRCCDDLGVSWWQEWRKEFWM